MTTGTHEIFQAHEEDLSTEERVEMAREAVKVFRTMQPALNAYAQILTRNPKMRVEVHSKSNGSTDGKRIYYRPPLALGAHVRHNRNVCDRRGPDKHLKCPACALRESVLVVIYHEIAHLCYGSFTAVDQKDLVDFTIESVKQTEGVFAEKILQRIQYAGWYEKNEYMKLANLISEWLPLLLNAIEDARVNREMFKARNGTKVMFDALIEKIFFGGVEQLDEHGNTVTIMWRDYPLNMQILVGVFCVASGYNYKGWFTPRVEDDLGDEKLASLIKKIESLRTASASYRLTFPILVRLRELGYCKLPDDPEEPEDEQSQEPEADEDTTDPSEEPLPANDGPDPESEEDGEGDQDEAEGEGGEFGDSSDEGTAEGKSEPEKSPAGNSGEAISDPESSDKEDDQAGGDQNEDGSPGSDAAVQPGEEGSESSNPEDRGQDGDADGGSESESDQGDGDSSDGESSVESDEAGPSSGDDGLQDGGSDGSSGSPDEGRDDSDGDQSNDEGSGGEESGGGSSGSMGSDGNESGSDETDSSEERGSSGGNAGSDGGLDDSDDDNSDEGESGSGAGDVSSEDDGDSDGLQSELGTDDSGEQSDGEGDDLRGSGSGNGTSESEEPSDGLEKDGNGSDTPQRDATSESNPVSEGTNPDGDLQSSGSESGGSGDPAKNDRADGQSDGSSSTGAPGTDNQAGIETLGGGDASESSGQSFAPPDDFFLQEDEILDQGSDLGSKGGITVVEEEGYEDHVPPQEYGTPEQGRMALLKLGDHQELPSEIHQHKHPHDDDDLDDDEDHEEAEAEVKRAFDRAIIQGAYFETPSTEINGVRIHKYGQPQKDESGRDVSSGWSGKGAFLTWSANSLSSEQAGIKGEFSTDESVLGKALQRLRRAFADNAKGGAQRHMKGGRVDRRVLGKRAPVGDERLFQRKTKKDKKDYFVVIGMDISGSTTGLNLMLIKKAALAQANLLQRLGIKFAVYAHSAYYHDSYRIALGMDLDIYEVKTPEEPWNEKTIKRLTELCPAEGNLDGHTLEFYRKIADKSTATERIIMYYTDGAMPASNYDEELEILQREIEVCKQKQITCMAVGIRTDSPIKHGLDTVKVEDDADIIAVVQHLERRLLTR